MDNFLNWKSVEKDGLPNKRGVYLVTIKEIRLFKSHIPAQVGIDCYYPELGMWRYCDSDKRRVTHYIPLYKIPIPE
ncbi:hypothetical protein BGI40_01670 [Snodgrassella communis]|jgi:hypothetical protein|uniref:hypothetical protein n=1 Tax=Snodgrassella communis TaxID=2946699 RepID=UPI00055D527E|nr:hypothetical protein [Snodgrassella communis]PIT10693.1 hypothetical protein BGI29_01630 [Snodgrassella communis]PIT30361.1 hypothetical protein BGI39_00710 [Snodgrassella communis]PIT30487.1 hypothetical protein BGI38_00765 [Snodgrassella communis]PIT37118.1 hypothetical protein BGI40_01670 [Snodgrassella communis]